MTESEFKNGKPRRQVYKKGRWSNDEEELFEEGLKYYHKDWRKIQRLIKSRSLLQVRSHAQKYFLKLQKLQIGSPRQRVEELSQSEKFRTENSAQYPRIEAKQTPREAGFSNGLPLDHAITVSFAPLQHYNPNVLFSNVSSFGCNNCFNPLGYFSPYSSIYQNLERYNLFTGQLIPAPSPFCPRLEMDQYQIQNPLFSPLPNSK